MPKLHVVGEHKNCSEAKVFASRGKGWEWVDYPQDADVVVLTGGSDINPALYGEMKITQAYSWKNYPARDMFEIKSVRAATKENRIILGICRGAQLCNVLAGGKLWQDVNKHQGDHEMFLVNQNYEKISTTSVHHQAMRVTREAEILATCFLSTMKFAQGRVWQKGDVKAEGMDDNDWLRWDSTDIEACWYPKQRYFCVQGHPEYPGGRELADWTYKSIIGKLGD